MTLAAAPGDSVVETAAYVIVRDSSFGALLLLAIIAVFLLVKQLMKLHEKRISDLKSVNTHVEAREDKAERLMERMTEAFTSFRSALDQMNSTGQSQTNAVNNLVEVVRKLDSTTDSVLREHARIAAAWYRRSPTPPPGYSDPPKKGVG
jgi:uncharacterized protein Yka (UPF0111/DUF47 family)